MSCNHGAVLSDGTIGILNSIAVDLKIIVENHEKPTPSQKILKKAMARIRKSVARASKQEEEAERMIRAELHGAAANDILEGDVKQARWLCKQASNLQLLLAHGDFPSSTIPAMYSINAKIGTDQGLVLYLAKQLPCKCLTHKKKEVKMHAKVGFCVACHDEHPVSELFECSRCKAVCYCSEVCQLDHWRQLHKRYCAMMAKEKETKAKATTGEGNKPGDA